MINLTLTIFLAVLSVSQEPTAERRGRDNESLPLTLKSSKKHVPLNEWAAVTATITNIGHEMVSLVLAGDGSSEGWRTPVIKWSVIPADDTKYRHAPPPTRREFRQCGNLDPMKPEQLVNLAPGKSMLVGCTYGFAWHGVRIPGRYSIRFYYRNDPALAWGDPSSLDPQLMKQVSKTFECSLNSNDLVIHIEKARPIKLRTRRATNGGIRP